MFIADKDITSLAIISLKLVLPRNNAGSLNQENFFKELIRFSNSLKEEERRAVVEGLTEEELPF